MQLNNLILELNADCNSNCVYCYMKKRRGHDDNSIRFFKSKLLDFSGQGIQNVDFTGGEPTLFKQLPELISYAKHLGYRNLTLVTNGRMLSYREYLKKLIDAGMNRAVLSFDGPDAKVAEAVTRSTGSYNQTIKAINNLKTFNIETGATIVITSINYRYICETIEQAISLGVDFINFQFMLPFVQDKFVPSQRIRSSIIPSYEETRPYVTKALKEYGPRIKINVHFIPFCQLEGFESFLEKEAQKDDRYALNYRGYGYNIAEHLRKGAMKGRICQKCRFNAKCIGFFASYAKELGVVDLINEELKIKRIEKKIGKMQDAS